MLNSIIDKHIPLCYNIDKCLTTKITGSLINGLGKNSIKAEKRKVENLLPKQ